MNNNVQILLHILKDEARQVPRGQPHKIILISLINKIIGKTNYIPNYYI